MHTPPSLAFAALITLQATLVTLWAMPCGILAAKGAEVGLGFWKTFLISFFLTPMAGMAAVLMARASQARQAVPERAIRSSAPASLRVSS